MKNIIIIIISISILLGLALNIGYHEMTFAETSHELLKTDGLSLDNEFLKALSNPLTRDYDNMLLDKDKNGILTLNEIKEVRYLNLYCTDCNICDWSGLQYFENLATLNIYEADFEKIFFDNVINSTLVELNFDFCTNFNKISGLEIFQNVKCINIYSEESISCKAFSNLTNLEILHITAPDVTDSDTLNIPNFKINTPIPTSTPLDTSNDVTSITIEGGEKITAYVGDELTFKTSFTPEGAWGIVSLSADKRYVATFSETIFDSEGNNCSVLTLWNPGTVTVTAKSLHIRRDGSEYYLTDTIVVEVLEPIITDTPKPTSEPFIKGDINSDKKVNAEDALLALKHAAKLIELDNESILIGDLNEDNNINSQDALAILKIAANITE